MYLHQKTGSKAHTRAAAVRFEDQSRVTNILYSGGPHRPKYFGKETEIQKSWALAELFRHTNVSILIYTVANSVWNIHEESGGGVREKISAVYV